jgi:carbon monoxide dehydrogenase subunit G
MDMTGERRIPAPREKVWSALIDPVVLQTAIPGCESLEKLSDTEMAMAAALKIGPIAAKFAGKVHLLDLDPPNSYRLEGEGQGGVAGFARGGAAVTLAEDGADTILKYDVHAQVGGKIAQLGARLIDATARQYADIFFDRFAAAVSPPPVETTPEVPMETTSETGQPAARPAFDVLEMLPRQPFGLPRVAWVGIVIYLFILVLVLGSLL